MVVIWSVNFILAKYALRELGPFRLASCRIVLAAVFMVIAYFLMAPEAGAPPAKPLRPRDIAWFSMLGALGIAGNQMGFTIGLHYTTVGHGALIIATGPITILLLARLMKLELLTLSKIGGMLLCFTGVLFLAFEHGLSLHGGTLKGDLIMWAGSFAFCLYTVLGKRVAAHHDTRTVNLYCYLAGGAIALPMAVQQARGFDWGRVTWLGWTGLVYMAMFASVVGYLIFYWALRHLAPSRIAAMTYFQPILAPLLGILLLGESLTQNLVLGGVLILCGVFLAERRALAQRLAA